MVYSYNRFKKLNPVLETAGVNSDDIFNESADIASVTEAITDAIINDDSTMFNIYIENCSSEVLTEGLKEIGQKIAAAIRKLIEMLKKIPGYIMEFFKKLMSKFKFKTDKNGTLTKEAVAQLAPPAEESEPSQPAIAKKSEPIAIGTKSWQSLYDFDILSKTPVKGSRNLRKKIEIVDLDPSNRVDEKTTSFDIEDLSGSVTINLKLVEKIIDDYFRGKLEVDGKKLDSSKYEDKAKFQEALKDYQKRMEEYLNPEGSFTSYKGNTEIYQKIPQTPVTRRANLLFKEDIDIILYYSNLDVKEVEDKFKDAYNKTMKTLQKFEKDSLVEYDCPNDLSQYFNQAQMDRAMIEKEIEPLYNEYGKQCLMLASQRAYESYNNACTFIEKAVAISSNARKYLEDELQRRYREEVMEQASLVTESKKPYWIS